MSDGRYGTGRREVARNRQNRRKNGPGGKLGLLVAVVLLILLAVVAVKYLKQGPLSNEAEKNPGNETTPLVTESASPVSSPSAESGAPGETVPPSETANTNSSSVGEDWQMLLVNRWNAIPEGYEVSTVTLSNGYEVDERIYPDLQEMFDDMRAQGIYPVVASGYRTAERQIELMNERIEGYIAQGYSTEDATAEALLWVAVPGTSEHQTGLAVDINADGIHSAGYEVYEWLAENAWQYGFILRYPEGKEDLTATDYEPWHYRYVGRENAKLIYESGLCLEEYLGNTDQSNPILYTYPNE